MAILLIRKKKKNFELYHNVTLFKPNLKELKEGLKIDFNEPDENIMNEMVKLLRDQNQAKIDRCKLANAAQAWVKSI